MDYKESAKLEDTDIFSARAITFLKAQGICTIKDLIHSYAEHGGMESIRILKSKRKFFAYDNSSYSDEGFQGMPVANMRLFFSVRARKALNSEEVHTIKNLVDFCNKYGILSCINKLCASEQKLKKVATLSREQERQKKIRNLKSSIKKYKHVLAHMEKTLAELERNRNI